MLRRGCVLLHTKFVSIFPTRNDKWPTLIVLQEVQVPLWLPLHQYATWRPSQPARALPKHFTSSMQSIADAHNESKLKPGYLWGQNAKLKFLGRQIVAHICSFLVYNLARHSRVPEILLNSLINYLKKKIVLRPNSLPNLYWPRVPQKS